MANGILAEFSNADIAVFKKDFSQVIKVGAEVDRYYSEAQHSLDTQIPKFEKLLEQFNKKYKGIKIKAKKTTEGFKVRVFVKSKSIKDFFAESASKIPGLKSAGKTNFNQFEVNDVERFASFLESEPEKAFLSYADQDNGVGTIVASLDKKEKMVELLYDARELASEYSSGFKICAYYAMKEGFDKKIEIYTEASAFGFENLLDEIEKREWMDRHRPNFLE